MKTLAVIAYMVLILWGIYKLTAVRDEQPEDWLNFPAADSHIERLNNLRIQVQNIEELLTDIQLHESGKSEAPVVLSWCSISGERHEAIIYINASSEVNMRLTELVKSERQRLRYSLQSELQNNPVRHNANVYRLKSCGGISSGSDNILPRLRSYANYTNNSEEGTA